MKEFDFDVNREEVLDSDFVLVQQDKKIKDKELETKATTFFKDALKRFTKNKSSVVGAIILGILILLAIFVPVVSPYDIKQQSTREKFLAPKLFNTNDKAKYHFWDGTREFTRMPYDTVNDVPAYKLDSISVDRLKRSVYNLKVDTEPSYIDVANQYAKGGYLMFAASVKGETEYVLNTYKEMVFTTGGNYNVQIVFGDKDGVQEGALGEYRIELVNADDENDVIILKDYSKDYSTVSFNISEAINTAGRTTFNGKLQFRLKSTNDVINYILIKSVTFTADDGVENAEILAKNSISDPTQTVLITKESTADKFPDGYWSCTGRKGIHAAEIYYCDFYLDTYELAFGEDVVTIYKSDLDNWVKLGYLTSYSYDSNTNEVTLVGKTDQCCIIEVDDSTVVVNPVTGKLLNFDATVEYYKYMGYDKIPIYLFGTNVDGQDAFKKAFTGLRTSLILGVITAAFCFAFGLVWGSISGYFGGTVDLLMERFCDILSGVPWIVMMTLFILHLGNNFGTFALALCLTSWMGTAGRTRTQFYRFKRREYVLASRTLGASDFRLIFRHILPNSLGTIITGSVLMIPNVIFSEASLAYLNLGLQGKESFGVMMSSNQQYLSTYPNLVIFPAVVLALMMISFNLFGNGLRDAMNPSLKGTD